MERDPIFDLVAAASWRHGAGRGPALEEFDDSIENGGDRVCIELHGTRFELDSVELREVGEDVTDTMQMTKFYLVDSVNRVHCQEAMRDA